MKMFLITELDATVANKVAAFLIANDSEELIIQFADVGCCPHFTVPIFALVDHFRSRGTKIDIVTPRDSAIERAFSSNLLDCPFGRICRFASMEEYLKIFNQMQIEVLKLPGIGKGFSSAFGWCLSEVMDNVIQHSGTGIGYVMVQYVPAERLLKTCVFDLGQGIRESFKGTKFGQPSAVEAVCMAVRPNVTSGNGQGNGLYGLCEIVKQSHKGRLQITSAGAKYTLLVGRETSERGELSQGMVGFNGTTLVDFQVVFSDMLSIDKVFDDALPTTDLWLEDHELDDETVKLQVLDIVPGAVSREFGRQMRNMVENIIDTEHKRVIIDFNGIELCSSAFVDELIGKLLTKYQFVNFSRMIGFAGIDGLPALLVNHSIRQRLSEEGELATDSVKDSTGTLGAGSSGLMMMQADNASFEGSNPPSDNNQVVKGLQ